VEINFNRNSDQNSGEINFGGNTKFNNVILLQATNYRYLVFILVLEFHNFFVDFNKFIVQKHGNFLYEMFPKHVLFLLEIALKQ
jgi:hypothetical protein